MMNIHTSNAPSAIGPYSQAIRAKDFLFCSGQIGLLPDGTLVTGGVMAEATQAMRNLEAILTAGGASLSDVVQTTIYLTNITDFSTVNDMYASFFTGSPYPSRITIGVNALPKGACIEIAMVAVCS